MSRKQWDMLGEVREVGAAFLYIKLLKQNSCHPQVPKKDIVNCHLQDHQQWYCIPGSPSRPWSLGLPASSWHSTASSHMLLPLCQNHHKLNQSSWISRINPIQGAYGGWRQAGRSARKKTDPRNDTVVSSMDFPFASNISDLELKELAIQKYQWIYNQKKP